VSGLDGAVAYTRAKVDTVQFVIEQAGCTSCAARIHEALAEVATVEAVDIDEAVDVALVRLSGSVSESRVNDVLGGASQGSGHRYRVQSGSWHLL
jgi:copper chaperone CopZ